MMSASASLASSSSIASLPSPRISPRVPPWRRWRAASSWQSNCESPKDITLDTTESRKASPTMVLRLATLPSGCSALKSQRALSQDGGDTS